MASNMGVRERASIRSEINVVHPLVDRHVRQHDVCEYPSRKGRSALQCGARDVSWRELCRRAPSDKRKTSCL